MDCTAPIAWESTVPSVHARKRMQKRSIPALLVDNRLAFTDPVPFHGGAKRSALMRKSWRRLYRHLGRQAQDQAIAAHARTDRYALSRKRWQRLCNQAG